MMDRQRILTLCACLAAALAGCTETLSPAAPSPSAARTSTPSPGGQQTPPAPHECLFSSTTDIPTVVYVVDQSGSMLDHLGRVRKDLVASFGQLTTEQKFHLVFYNAQLSEGPREDKTLTPATDEAKYAAWKFTEDLQAHGRGNPLPAIERAFTVLDTVAGRKIIHFVSDGSFPDNRTLLATFNHLNLARTVQVNTYLCGRCSPEAEKVLKAIATESGGQFRALPQK